MQARSFTDAAETRNVVRTKSPLQAEKILDAAAQLFACQRFHKARMEDVAALAEVGKGTLYRYFKDKEELYHALLERAATGISARLCAETATADGFRSRLEAMVRAIVGYFDDNPHLFDLIQHAEAMSQPQALLPWHRWRDEVLSRVVDIFEDAQRTAAVTIKEPELVALLFLGSLRAVIRFGVRPRPADLAVRVVDLLLDGVALSKKANRRVAAPSPD
jgi:TetR/AcrR family fatty acid metabolism transcriptional regulator